MKSPPPPDDNSPAAIIVQPATQRPIAKEAARLSCRHDFRHDDLLDIQAALRADLFERLQSLDPGRDHAVLYLQKAMDFAFIDLARTRHRLRRRGDASTLLIDVAEPGFALSCDSFTSADRVMATCWGGGKPNRLRVGIERTQLWRFNLDGMAKLIANRAGASGRVEFSQTDRLVVAGSIQFRGTTHELFLALGASWRDARAIIAPAGRLQRSALPILLSLSRVAPFDTWLAMRPIGASVGLIVRWTSAGVSVDLNTFATSESVPHPSAGQVNWLTVPKDAELLCDVRSGVILARARARVSRAAGDGRLRTNGQKGSARRIHDPSLSL